MYMLKLIILLYNVFSCVKMSMNANKYYPQLQCVVLVHYHRQQSIIHGDATLFDCQNEKEHMFEPISCPCLSGGNDLKQGYFRHLLQRFAIYFAVLLVLRNIFLS